MRPSKRPLVWLGRALTVLLAAVTVAALALYLWPNQAPPVLDFMAPGEGDGIERWRLGEWGHAARTERWAVYFTAPGGESDRNTYRGGLDGELAAAIDQAERRIDIAAYDFGHEGLLNALAAAIQRGVALRVIADDSNREEFAALRSAGARLRFDERSALMHNKFILIDEREVWLGSLNYTENGIYRNNNHLLRLRQPALVAAYRAEFEELFGGDFGRQSAPGNTARGGSDGFRFRVMFAPENEILPAMQAAIRGARKSIHFLAFSFTLDELRLALLERHAAGVEVRGVFDSRLAGGQGSEFPRLFCAGLSIFLDGNPYAMHHKFFIIDGRAVMTGSLNFSVSGTQSNDENWLWIEDEQLAAQFLAEYERVFAAARTPSEVDCG